MDVQPLVERILYILYSKLFYSNDDGVVDTWAQDVLIIILI
jgi:hypothetical protein